MFLPALFGSYPSVPQWPSHTSHCIWKQWGEREREMVERWIRDMEGSIRFSVCLIWTSDPELIPSNHGDKRRVNPSWVHAAAVIHPVFHNPIHSSFSSFFDFGQSNEAKKRCRVGSCQYKNWSNLESSQQVNMDAHGRDKDKMDRFPIGIFFF